MKMPESNTKISNQAFAEMVADIIKDAWSEDLTERKPSEWFDKLYDLVPQLESDFKRLGQ